MVDFKRHQKDSANGQCGQAVKVEPFEVVQLDWDDDSGAAGVWPLTQFFLRFFCTENDDLFGWQIDDPLSGRMFAFIPSCNALVIVVDL